MYKCAIVARLEEQMSSSPWSQPGAETITLLLYHAHLQYNMYVAFLRISVVRIHWWTKASFLYYYGILGVILLLNLFDARVASINPLKTV